MLKDKSMTYVTLFSSAGVGCHGFQMEGYHCIATNEIIERRMQVQRCNHKCDDDSGYIVGDITSEEIKQRIYDEIHRWEKKGNDRVDVMHHIFPQSEFAEIADYIENLIALTSGQHLQKAHPNGNTRIIDKQYYPDNPLSINLIIPHGLEQIKLKRCRIPLSEHHTKSGWRWSSSAVERP